jgi:prolyl oligopeptidase PreP (S9A serine peptidase family)
VLVTTGDRDNRVVPGHSFKFTAAPQAACPSDASPVLIRVETAADQWRRQVDLETHGRGGKACTFAEAALNGELAHG